MTPEQNYESTNPKWKRLEKQYDKLLSQIRLTIAVSLGYSCLLDREESLKYLETSEIALKQIRAIILGGRKYFGKEDLEKLRREIKTQGIRWKTNRRIIDNKPESVYT